MKETITLTKEDLITEYGKSISDIELSKYFGIDVRTLRKYASYLKGVMVLPGRYVFFENLLKEIIENAELNHKEWYQKISGQRTNSFVRREKKTENISRRQQAVLQGSGIVGRRNETNDESGDDRHGLFNSQSMG